MRKIYLDYAATTPLDPRVLDAMVSHFREEFGNPSSVHAYGREAKAVLEESRHRIARFIGARSEELFFTSGGTEADNHAIRGVARAVRPTGKNHVITSLVEHHAVLRSVELLREEGFEVTFVRPNPYGSVDPEEVQKAIRPTTCLISLMHANNEVGSITSLREISAITREHEIILHSDTVQSVGKMPIDVDELGVDLLSISAHKFYGPKGIGAIYIRKGTPVDSLIHGGSQESNRRAGTENVPLSVGFAKAVELCDAQMEDDAARVRGLRDRLCRRLEKEFEGVLFNGHPTETLPHIISISFDTAQRPFDGEALIMGMDLQGVAVTSGSACTSGSLQPSHVLVAMGRDPETARATVRFSLGRWTTADEIDYALDALREVTSRVRAASGS